MRRFLCLFALVSACGHTPRSTAQHPMLGQSVSLSLPSDSGALVSVPSPEARATVVDFWAPSCGPCRTGVPALVAKQGELRAKGAELVLVGVLSAGESTEEARGVLASWGVRAPFLIDRGESAKKEAGVTSLPATLVLGPGGKLLWVAPTGATAEDVAGAVP